MASDCLRRAMERGILLERKVRAHTIVVGRVIRQQMAEMPFPQLGAHWPDPQFFGLAGRAPTPVPT